MDIQCKFDEWPWVDESKRRYTANIKKRIIPDNSKIRFDGKHLIPHGNNDVTGINFMACRVIKIPGPIMIQHYPWLEAIALSNCGLRSILKEDFKGLVNLKVLWLNDNELEYLPGDLFEETRKVEYVSFEKNKIRYIDAELLDPLMNVKLINFFGNAAIDKVYNAAFLTQGNATLEEIRNEIINKCKPPWRNESNPKVLQHQESLSMELYKKIIECDELNVKCKIYEDEIERLKEEAEGLKTSSMFCDIQKIIADEDFKDFSILTKGEKFRAHKFLLAARSPTLATMIQNRPDADSLTLTDIPVKAFKIILDFIYTDKLPTDCDNEINFIELFTASTRLGIEKLRVFTVEKLKEELDQKNAFDILLLANKHSDEELKMQAFEEIQKIFPEKELKIELASQPDKIKKLLDMKKKLNEELENI